jgi:glycine/D-amino acid oxidase-like deaminating enzyme
MQAAEKKDMLILGYGLAGGFLAAELATRGHRVTVMDDFAARSASRTAAGLFNIITGRYAATTWQATELLAHLHRFFTLPRMESLSGHLHLLRIYRPFLNTQEANDWAAKSAHAPLRDWVRIVPPRDEHLLVNPLGGIEIQPSGWLDVPAFLADLAEVLEQHFGVRFLRQALAPEQLDATRGEVAGVGRFDAVISAQGMAATRLPQWAALPLKALKGQVLELEADGLPLDYAVSRGTFLIPKGGGLFTCGSTYEHHFEDDTPTEAGQQKILTQLGQTLRTPVRVVAARAAVRPTTPDRRPLLGRHPLHPKLYAVNGMGTKGVLQAPWCACQLADLLEERVKILPPDVEITRFGVDFS